MRAGEIAGAVLAACMAGALGAVLLAAAAGEDSRDRGDGGTGDRGIPTAPMPARMASGDVRDVLPVSVMGTIYPERDHFVDTNKMVTAYADLDALYHPGTDEALVVAAATGRVRALGGSLSDGEARAVLGVAGWPEGLHDAALRVAWCESKWSPYAVGDGGASVGWFQLNQATWFPYAGEDIELWADPLVNARVAWATYLYDIDRGYAPWAQWSCKP